MNVSHEPSHSFSFILESFKSLSFVFPRGVIPSIPLFCHYNMYSLPHNFITTASCLTFIPFSFLPFLSLFMSLYTSPTHPLL